MFLQQKLFPWIVRNPANIRLFIFFHCRFTLRGASWVYNVRKFFLPLSVAWVLTARYCWVYARPIEREFRLRIRLEEQVGKWRDYYE